MGFLNLKIFFNRTEYLFQHHLDLNLHDLVGSPLYKATIKAIKAFKIIDEVKFINTTCNFEQAAFQKTRNLTFTIDRVKPYEVDSKHKGISRVLQSFEVVLLTVLVYEVLNARGISVSLDHDGVLAMFPRKWFEENQFSTDDMINRLQNSGKFEAWSTYLLKEKLPIEVKRYVVNGKVHEL